jgi:hypothetical protein
MDIRWKEGETQAQIDEAKWILEALDAAYPGHPWSVRVYDGGFFIRHMDLPSNWGMNCKGSYSSASLLKRDVIMQAGEFLERAGVPRTRWDDDNSIKRVEGIPEKWQPEQIKPKLDIEKLVATAEREMRDQPLPHLLEKLKNGD